MARYRRRKKRPQDIFVSPAMLARAEREAALNKARIEAGETFASHKPNTWKRAGKRAD